MKNLLVIITVMASLLMVSCIQSEKDCLTYNLANITDVVAPDSASVNEDVAIEVTFIVSNGCGGFNEFQEGVLNNGPLIQVESVYEGCVCTEAIETIKVDYIFNKSTPGPYDFAFRSNTGETILKTIVIN